MLSRQDRDGLISEHLDTSDPHFFVCLFPPPPFPSLQGKGVYQFEDKYGANVDGYSPIISPDTWASNGDTYKLGTTGLLIW